jgi:leucine dehydrogenase
MTVFENATFDDHELVTFARDPESGLRAIIAVHNSSRGPALGGCRMWPYAGEADAIADALRLSRGMTYKSALAGLPFGGGKSVILGDPGRDKTPALLAAMGRAVEALGGRYTIAEDVGIGVPDVTEMARATRHVAGVPSGENDGDPSPATAYGVFMGIKAAVRHKFETESLNGLRVAIQGTGAVGQKLARHLANEGAEVLVADVAGDRAARVAAALDLRAIPATEVLSAPVDVLAPCALGGVINDETLPAIQAGIVAGGANNQLAESRHGAALQDRGILYAPDYVINAGGIIHISHEGESYDRARAFAHVARIHETLMTIFERARKLGVPTATAADRLAEEHFTHPNPSPAKAA